MCLGSAMQHSRLQYLFVGFLTGLSQPPQAHLRIAEDTTYTPCKPIATLLPCPYMIVRPMTRCNKRNVSAPKKPFHAPVDNLCRLGTNDGGVILKI